MHPNPAFRQSSLQDNLAFARSRGFGLLSVNGADGPLVAHVLVLLDDGGTSALIHLARSNAIAREDLPAKAVFVILGPDAYISPDWYGASDQVPTWNYVAVHLRGVLCPLPDAALAPMVDALSEHFEAGLAPKPAWTSAKMSDGMMARILRMILPFQLQIASVEGTWKLNQNKTPAQRHGLVAALGAGDGIAGLMRTMDD